jgi:hypothetical protein
MCMHAPMAHRAVFAAQDLLASDWAAQFLSPTARSAGVAEQLGRPGTSPPSGPLAFAGGPLVVHSNGPFVATPSLAMAGEHEEDVCLPVLLPDGQTLHVAAPVGTPVSVLEKVTGFGAELCSFLCLFYCFLFCCCLLHSFLFTIKKFSLYIHNSA